MRRRLRVALFIAAAAVIFLLFAKAVNARAYSDDEAHRQFDGVLHPRFIAAMNEWALAHPRTPEHYATFDVKDAKRWQAVRAAWRELDEAAKRMGY
jgi:hypothetical protein